MGSEWYLHFLDDQVRDLRNYGQKTFKLYHGICNSPIFHHHLGDYVWFTFFHKTSKSRKSKLGGGFIHIFVGNFHSENLGRWMNPFCRELSAKNADGNLIKKNQPPPMLKALLMHYEWRLVRIVVHNPSIRPVISWQRWWFHFWLFF